MSRNWLRVIFTASSATCGLMLCSPIFPIRAAETAVWQERPLAAEQATPLPAGAVWFRAWLKVPDNMAGAGTPGADLWRDSMSLTLRDLPGPVVVFLNGQKFIETRDVAAAKPQRFKVPNGLFAKGAYNAVVIRLDGTVATSERVRPPRSPMSSNAKRRCGCPSSPSRRSCATTHTSRS